MTRMIMNIELFLDHPANHGGCPDPTVQTVSRWPAVQDVSQLSLLFLRQFRRPTRPIPFQQALNSLNLITLQPLRDLRPRRLQDIRELATGTDFGIEHHRSQTFRHSVSSVFLCFLAQTGQALIGAWM